MSTETHRQPIVVTHDGGVQFTAQVRSHRVIVDQPAYAGGADAGPMPIEMLGVSLGTCIALYVQQFLNARHIPHEGMRVEVESHGARNPSRIAAFEVRVMLPHPLPPAYAELLERVARSCPAHNTLERSADIQVTITVAEPAGV